MVGGRKSKEYFVTHENYMKFKFQFSQIDSILLIRGPVLQQNDIQLLYFEFHHLKMYGIFFLLYKDLHNIFSFASWPRKPKILILLVLWRKTLPAPTLVHFPYFTDAQSSSPEVWSFLARGLGWNPNILISTLLFFYYVSLDQSKWFYMGNSMCGWAWKVGEMEAKIHPYRSAKE